MATGRRGGTTRGRARAAKPSRTIKTTSRQGSTARRAAPPDDLAARVRTLERTLRADLETRRALEDMVEAVNAPLDPTRIGDAVIERLTSRVPAASWAVVIPDTSGHLAIVAERSLPDDLYPSSLEIGRWVAAHEQPFLSADLDADLRIAVTGAVAVVALPLVSRGRTLGAIIALDHPPSRRAPGFSPPVLRGLAALLAPAAVALDNATRLRRIEALSVTDDLTGLYNSRFLNQALHRESKRALRSGRPLSLLFLDLDGFKNVNDAHGHLLGSRALVETAEVIRACSRESDIVARFGGDEFAVVLPDTGASGAWSVAQRIRERLAGHKFLVAEGLEVRLTVSIGIATLPDSASSSDELIEAADAAMYRVKDRGKNGIEAAARPADT